MRVVFPLFVFLFLVLDTQAQITVSAEIRPRAEFRDGFKRPLNQTERPAFFIEQRSRIYLSYSNEKMDLVLVPQDVRIWGNTDQAGKTDPSLTNFQQAWAGFKFNGAQRFLVGRMELDYDNARILGNLDWAQQGRSHDLLKYEYNGSKNRLHIGLAFNQDANNPEPTKLSETYYQGLNNYKSLQFAWFHHDFKQISTSIIALNEGRQHAPDTGYFMQTAGFNMQASFAPFVFYGEGYYQTGKNKDGFSKRAFLASLQLSFKPTGTYKIELGNDYLSGDKQSSKTNEAFDPLYGTHHKFYGYMDYFYVGSGHGNKGLNDLFLKVNWIKKNWTISMDGHHFSAASAITDEEGIPRSRDLGTELDWTFSYSLAKEVNLKGGYSHLFYTSSMAIIKQVGSLHGQSSWAWLMITFKPTLFQDAQH